MKIRKKSSEDYGLYCFRVTKAERNEIAKLVSAAKTHLNRNKKEDEYVITKNQIILEAIKLGLPLIRKTKN